MKRYLSETIEEHRATFDGENIRDFIDLYLKATRDGSDSELFTGNCFMFFFCFVAFFILFVCLLYFIHHYKTALCKKAIKLAKDTKYRNTFNFKYTFALWLPDNCLVQTLVLLC